MGLLNAPPKLEPGEAVRWQALASHVAGPSAVFFGSRTSSSGRLFVTDRRVFYQPSRVDTAFSQEIWERPRSSVIGLEEVERDEGDVFAAGFRRRLGIRTEAGVEAFVVNDLDSAMAELSELLLRPSS